VLLQSRPADHLSRLEGRHLVVDAGEALAFQADDINLEAGRVLVDGPVGLESEHRELQFRRIATTSTGRFRPGIPRPASAEPLRPTVP
jgi:hypothetical protein